MNDSMNPKLHTPRRMPTARAHASPLQRARHPHLRIRSPRTPSRARTRVMGRQHDDRWTSASTMHVIESLDDLRALVASDDVKIVCVGAKASLETPEFARAVFGTNERAITTFHKMVSSISAESTRSTVLTFGSADEGATLVELVVSALPEKTSSKPDMHSIPQFPIRADCLDGS